LPSEEDLSIDNLTVPAGEIENRLKECQLDLIADCTSAHTMRANQLRYGSHQWPMS
jgi:hypothetical protein